MKFLALVLLLSTFSSLTLMEVVKDFARSSCSKFFIRSPNSKPVITPTVFKGYQYKKICQRWNKKYTFATLYDIKQRIPVYSAYTFSGDGPKLDQSKSEWKNEPQLENMSNGPDMREISDAEMDEFFHQAVNRDYRDSVKSTNISYTRGHVFPNGYAADQDQADSTYTFTNVAPQTKPSNNKWAEQVEEPMKGVIKNKCKLNDSNPAFIVTGVVPGNKWIKIKRYAKRTIKTFKEGVNIPSFYWTAFCCYIKEKTTFSGVYLVRQIEPNNTPEKIPKNVDELNQRLSSLYNKDFKVFSNLCLT
ncbi:endonuclease domain-containing 1 protein-like isoform X1 [Hemibagrus wyckioides]|uniref:endonuclease domain-containing 1 protein-like isoform X1 n=1 Tax=Hemibagrus wyckioides TaxID=337641 RepID=UPI00266D1F10|nr:endonuclease domain-containing 1 protein-like isoform X1 [Hemibagrus wyckioides]XP_058258306.1 endonuclease domain-containing 1 protein-like isoform X1 [Hemibagrus wyckioides]XP_058258307.1 endonuclease domain-containing 1 protein-like isoform X1 [Hemibagrus wyckioides]